MVFFGFIVSKKGKLLDLKKIQAIVNMLVPSQIQIFNGMALFYRCFIKTFPTIMALITNFTRKAKKILWIECQKTWELIKKKCIETLILIAPKWDVEFHVHRNASLLVVGTLLAHNITRKNARLLNSA